MWDIRGMTCMIALEKPGIGITTCEIGTRTCNIGNCKFNHTPNYLKSQYLRMISPIFSHLYLSYLQLYYQLRLPSYVVAHYLSMSWSRDNTNYSIYWIMHHPVIPCLPLTASHWSLCGPCCTELSSVIPLRASHGIVCHYQLCLLSEIPPQDWLPPCTPPITLNSSCQANLHTHPITA